MAVKLKQNPRHANWLGPKLPRGIPVLRPMSIANYLGGTAIYEEVFEALAEDDTIRFVKDGKIKEKEANKKIVASTLRMLALSTQILTGIALAQGQAFYNEKTGERLQQLEGYVGYNLGPEALPLSLNTEAVRAMLIKPHSEESSPFGLVAPNVIAAQCKSEDLILKGFRYDRQIIVKAEKPLGLALINRPTTTARNGRPYPGILIANTDQETMQSYPLVPSIELGIVFLNLASTQLARSMTDEKIIKTYVTPEDMLFSTFSKLRTVAEPYPVRFGFSAT